MNNRVIFRCAVTVVVVAGMNNLSLRSADLFQTAAFATEHQVPKQLDVCSSKSGVDIRPQIEKALSYLASLHRGIFSENVTNNVTILQTFIGDCVDTLNRTVIQSLLTPLAPFSGEKLDSNVSHYISRTLIHQSNVSPVYFIINVVIDNFNRIVSVTAVIDSNSL